jgi:hypothetical protein
MATVLERQRFNLCCVLVCDSISEFRSQKRSLDASHLSLGTSNDFAIFRITDGSCIMQLYSCLYSTSSSSVMNSWNGCLFIFYFFCISHLAKSGCHCAHKILMHLWNSVVSVSAWRCIPARFAIFLIVDAVNQSFLICVAVPDILIASQPAFHIFPVLRLSQRDCKHLEPESSSENFVARKNSNNLIKNAKFFF